MERYRRRHKRPVTLASREPQGCAPCGGNAGPPAWFALDCAGQGTVEYALVLFAFLALAAGLSALLGLFDGGAMVAHGIASASHGLSSAGGVADALLY